MQSLLRTADQLKIKGLCESPEEKENSETPIPFVSRPYSKFRKISSPKHFKPLDGNRKQRIKREKVEKGNSSDQEEDADGKDNGLRSNTSDEENETPVDYDEDNRRRKQSQPQTKPLNMSSHGMMTGQVRINSSIPVSPPSLLDACLSGSGENVRYGDAGLGSVEKEDNGKFALEFLCFMNAIMSRKINNAGNGTRLLRFATVSNKKIKTNQWLGLSL